MSIRRINKELQSAPKDGTIKFIEIVNDNITSQRWAVKPGLGDTIAFNDTHIYVSVIIPHQYPFSPPTVKLEKNIFHPNVNNHLLCLNSINNWKPNMTIMKVMEEILNIIMYPNTDAALNDEALELYKSDHRAYVSRARFSAELKN